MFNFYVKQKHFGLVLLIIPGAALSSCNQNEPSESSEKPEDNRFTKVVLTQGFDEPMAMTFINNQNTFSTMPAKK